jgi:tetratricopeptide (TPR) repeat protein
MTRFSRSLYNGNQQLLSSQRSDSFFHDNKENIRRKQTIQGSNSVGIAAPSTKVLQQQSIQKHNTSIALPPNKRDVKTSVRQPAVRNHAARRNQHSKRKGSGNEQASVACTIEQLENPSSFFFNHDFDQNIKSTHCSRENDADVWANASFPAWNDITSDNNTDMLFFEDFSQNKNNLCFHDSAACIPSLSPPKRDTIKKNPLRRKSSTGTHSTCSLFSNASSASFFDNNEDDDTEQLDQVWNEANIYSSTDSFPPTHREIFKEGYFKGNDSLAFSACLKELAIRRSDSNCSEFSSSMSEMSMPCYDDFLNADESSAWNILPTPKDISLSIDEPNLFEYGKENFIEATSQSMMPYLALSSKDTRRQKNMIMRSTSGASMSSVIQSEVPEQSFTSHEETATYGDDPSINNHRQYERALRSYYVGCEFFSLGRFDDSMDALRESMQHFETYNVLQDSSFKSSRANVQVASCLFGIASIYLQKKNYSMAIQGYEEMLHILSSTHGRDYFNKDSAEAYHKLGFICYIQQNYEESLLYLKKALQAYRSLWKKQQRLPKTATTTQKSSPMIGIVLNNTGNVYHKLGILSQALSFYKQALHTWSSNGKDSILSYSVSTWNNIGVIHFQECNYEKSVEAYGKVLQILSHRLGSNHSSIRDRNTIGDKVIMARTLTMIGFVNAQLGDIDDSISSFKAAQSIYRSVFGDNHLHIAEVLECIGRAQECRGENTAALSTYKKVWEILQVDHKLRDNHPSVVRILTSISRLIDGGA